LFLFTNLLLSLSLFFILCLFFNLQFLIWHQFAVLDLCNDSFPVHTHGYVSLFFSWSLPHFSWFNKHFLFLISFLRIRLIYWLICLWMILAECVNCWLMSIMGINFSLFHLLILILIMWWTTRCMSLNLTVKYADVIHSVILHVSFVDGLCYLVVWYLLIYLVLWFCLICDANEDY